MKDRTHIPCPSCREDGHDESGNNLALFENEDGTITGYCFRENKYYKNPLSQDIEELNTRTTMQDFTWVSKLQSRELLDRKISKEAADKFGVKVLCSEENGEPTHHFYPYYKDGKIVGYKERKIENKEFHVIGNIRGCELFGQHVTTGNKFLIIVEGECFTGETEVLTPNGWIRLDQWNGQQVMQVDHDLVGWFTDPFYKIEKEYDGNLVSYSTGSWKSLTTEQHDLAALNTYGELYKRKAVDRKNRHHKIPRTLSETSIMSSDYSENELRIMVMLSADFNMSPDQGGYRASFKKERKIERCRDLLNKSGLKYSENKSETYTHFRVFKDNNISSIWKKEFDHSLFGKLTVEDINIILEEILHWDGNSVPNRDQIEYATKYYSNATFIQTLAHLVGHTSSIIKRKNKYGRWYKVSILYNKTTSSLQKEPTLIPYKGKVHCLAVPKGYLLVRYKDSISISGNCDALATYDILKRLNKNYNVVSVVNGANKRAIQNNLEFVESFESVVLCFDQDEPGKKAAKDVAELLSPGKAKIATLPCKDPNDCLKENKHNEFLRSIYSAKEFRPDGIVRLSQAYDELFRDDNIESIPYPWEGLNRKLYGIRPREIITITSGSGMGKSAVVREIEHWLFKKTTDNIGVLALEESIGRTQWGILSIEASLPLHIREERRDISQEKIRSWWDATIGTGRFISYDHFGSTTEDNLINQIRYLIKGMDCKWIILDHLSIVVSSMDESGDERRTIDSIMTKLRTLVEETGAGLVLVSHLRRPSGDKGHERGAEVTLSQLRGSHSIAQLSDAVLGLERNQQATDEREQNLTKVSVLKNRYSGYTGLATNLFYNRETGRLYEVEDPEGWFLGEVQEKLPNA